MLRVTFTNSESRDAFANRFKLTTLVGENQLDIGWHLLQFAKLDPTALDYDELAVLTVSPDANTEREFVVKGDPTTFGNHATVVEDLGNGFYLVKSSDGTLLGDHVESIEHNSAPIVIMGNSSSLEQMNAVPIDIDPTASTSQWARIRAISRYRPLLTTYKVYESKNKSKPELYVMDSGIDFSHPEFQYDGLETEDFYTLPAFNGSFADDKGHGTAVASMAVGKNLGVATYCKLINVKIGGMSHNATIYEVGQAIDAIVARAANEPFKTRIVNMSWGVARSAYLDSKVEGMQNMGITVICAAGNNGISVEDISPAGIDSVITVGSIDKYDIPSGFNNISPSDAGVTTGSGLSLDIFAPGEEVIVAKLGGGYYVGSGTSFAAPLVSGVATIIGSLNSTMVPVSDMKNFVLSTATKDALLFEDDRFSENQNNLVYNILGDPNGNNKVDEISSYIGFLDHSSNIKTLTIDLKTNINHELTASISAEPMSWSIKWENSDLEAEWNSYFDLNKDTGVLIVNIPPVPLQFPEDTKIRLIEFFGVAENSLVKMETSKIIFFYCNPNYQISPTDITLALTDTNAISFYSYWPNIK